MEVESSGVEIILSSQSTCDGSATVKIKQTEAVAGCYGPLESRTSSLAVEGQLEVAYKSPGATVTTPEDVEVSLLLKNSFIGCVKLIPRTVTSLSVRLLADDSGGFVAAFLASVASLIDAGIPMIKVPIGVECILSDSKQIIFEPTASQRDESSAQFIFVFAGDDEGPISISMNGRCERALLKKVIDMSRERAVHFRTILDHAIKTTVEADADLCI